MKSAVDRMLTTDAQNLQQMGADMSELAAFLRAAVDGNGTGRC